MRASLAITCVAVTVVACSSDTTEVGAATKIEVKASSSSLFAGDSVRFTATVREVRGEAIPTARVKWTSGDTTRLRVDSTGLGRVVFTPTKTEPSIQVTASYGAITGSTSVTFVFFPALNVWPDTNVLYVGTSRTLVSRLINSESGLDGPDIVPAPAVWKTSDASIATVNLNGVVTAKATGHARIVGMLLDGRADTADVFVVEAPSSPLRFTSIGGGPAISKIAASYLDNLLAHGCGLTATGEVYCWGTAYDATGPTDRCEIPYRSGPAQYSLYRFRCSEIPYRLPSPVAFTSIVASGEVGCGVATTKKIYCWGTNARGDLGIGTTDSVQHGVAQIASSDDFISVHVPEISTLISGVASSPCGLRTDRTLVCWGGAMGPTPKVIPGLIWQKIADASRCGIASDSTAYCFTSGVAQRVGDSTHWASIATAANSTLCATDVTGQTYCGGTTTFPTLVTDAPAYSMIDTYTRPSGFNGSVCGLGDGDVYCVGIAAKPAPADLGGIKLGRFFGTCGLGSDGKAYCWTFALTSRTFKFRLIPGQ